MQTLTIGAYRATLAPTRDVGAFQAKLAKCNGKSRRLPLRDLRTKAGFPVFEPGMSTAEYVRLYSSGDGSQLKAWEWAQLNDAPCTLYSGEDTCKTLPDGFESWEDFDAAQSSSAAPESAPAAANDDAASSAPDPEPAAPVDAPAPTAAGLIADAIARGRSRTPIAHLPIYARLAIERADADSALRTSDKVRELICAYARTYGAKPESWELESALYICGRRFWDFDAAPTPDPVPTHSQATPSADPPATHSEPVPSADPLPADSQDAPDVAKWRAELRSVEDAILRAAPARYSNWRYGCDIEAAARSRSVPADLKRQRKYLRASLQGARMMADAVQPAPVASAPPPVESRPLTPAAERTFATDEADERASVRPWPDPLPAEPAPVPGKSEPEAPEDDETIPAPLDGLDVTELGDDGMAEFERAGGATSDPPATHSDRTPPPDYRNTWHVSYRTSDAIRQVRIRAAGRADAMAYASTLPDCIAPMCANADDDGPGYAFSLVDHRALIPGRFGMHSIARAASAMRCA